MPVTLDRELILGSASPRRREILEDSGMAFTVIKPEAEETYPDHFQTTAVPVYLAEKKAQALKAYLEGRVIITADTIVSLDSSILGKPSTKEAAKGYLEQLSGRTHTVTTGVCLTTTETQESFYESSEVTFRRLSEAEIDHYIETGEPFDKAGAYGIQEWIGIIGVEGLQGSYLNVMGLPMGAIYQRLQTIAGLALSQA
jgi:septum formation protein